MRRSLCACLLAVMALAGGAHADWYWSPRRAIVRGSDTDYTNSNNARCIVEQGGKLNAVLVRDTFPSGNPVKQVYYTNSTDWGEMGTLPIYAKCTKEIGSVPFYALLRLRIPLRPALRISLRSALRFGLRTALRVGFS